ncbi:MAG: cytidine deaminase [Rubrobacteraceae bacterium]
MDQLELMDLAKQAAEKAYAPYSGFHVGAAILTEEGVTHTGCNVENASYGLAVCAERNATATMTLATLEDREIKTVAIASPDAAPCFPCGACRQVLREFNCKEVLVEGSDGGVKRYPFEEMLPNSFGPEAL